MKKILLSLLIISIVYFDVNAQKIWGSTLLGGADGIGLIYSYDYSSNTLTSEFEFSIYNKGGSSHRSGLTKASNGKLYAVTRQGGTGSSGRLFEYDHISKNYSVKYNFPSVGTNVYPMCNIIEANGALYMITKSSQSTNQYGSIYKYDLATGITTNIHTFIDSTGLHNTSLLTLASNSKIYAVASNGGSNNSGVIWELDPATDSYTVVHHFTSSIGLLDSKLTELESNFLYGASHQKMFKFNFSTGIVTILPTNIHWYTYGFEGFFANNTATKFLGVSEAGGANNKGAIFEYDLLLDTLTIKVDLDDSTGYYPNAGLIKHTDGMYYSVAHFGGAHNGGAIIRYNTTTNVVTRLFDFSNKTGQQSDSEILIENGIIYGVTRSSGLGSQGSLFSYDIINQNFNVEFYFSDKKDGAWPRGMNQINQELVGTTQSGGSAGSGTLFSISSSNPFLKNVDFDTVPSGYLTNGGDGYYYGYHNGGVYQYNPINKTILPLNNASSSIPNNSSRGLTLANNGKFYFTSIAGGANNKGALFSFDKSNNLITNLYDFTVISDRPSTNLVLVGNRLIGGTANGGANDFGTIYSFDVSTNTMSVVHDFDSIQGDFLSSDLLVSQAGTIYGVTRYGGTNNQGVLFEFTLSTNAMTTVFNFDSISGSEPSSSSLVELNDVILGTTHKGGLNNGGVIFEYNKLSSLVTKKVDFSTINGRFPSGRIVEFDPTSSLFEKTKESKDFSVYPTPVDNILNIELEGNTEPFIIQIINSTGQVLQAHQSNSNSNQIDVSQLPAGIYFVQLEDENKNLATRKFIKK